MISAELSLLKEIRPREMKTKRGANKWNRLRGKVVVIKLRLKASALSVMTVASCRKAEQDGLTVEAETGL